MFKWLHGGNSSKRVGLIESLSVGGKRNVILVRRDNIEHLVLVGGRTDVVIEPNIARRPVPNQRTGLSPQRGGYRLPVYRHESDLQKRPRRAVGLIQGNNSRARS